MKPAKPDYFDPELRGKEDGKGMDDLPRIVNPALRRTSAVLSQSAALNTEKDTLAKRSTRQSTSQSPSPSTDQLVNQLVNWSTNPSIDRSTILGRPKAFYITQKQDEDLDIAVEKLSREMGDKTNQKIDRSTLLRLLLEESEITSAQTIDRLASRLVGRLVSRLASDS